MNDARPMHGRTALVTGAGRGIGLGFALRLADLGADVAVLDVDLEGYRAYESDRATVPAGSIVEELASRGVRALGITADIRDREAMTGAVQEIRSYFGRLDTVICNAGGGSGFFGYPRDVDAISHAASMPDDYARLIVDVNLFGTINTCVAAIPLMLEAGGGTIVTIASIAGTRPFATGAHTPYGVAKSGVISYTRYLASDLAGTGIRANCAALGLIDTGGMREAMAARSQTWSTASPTGVPLGRYGTIADCANVVVDFLSTDLSAYVTGEVLAVAGGMAMHAK